MRSMRYLTIPSAGSKSRGELLVGSRQHYMVKKDEKPTWADLDLEPSGNSMRPDAWNRFASDALDLFLLFRSPL